MAEAKVLLRPDERILGLDATIGDFWSWAYSDVLFNANRSVLAEYLVGRALGCVELPRTEWNAVDFRYRGYGIEVKSSAYLQSWPQQKLSTIVFDIGAKKGWHAAGQYLGTRTDTQRGLLRLLALS